MNAIADGQLCEGFEFPALVESPLLHPIRTWEEMYREIQETGVDFDEGWYQSATEGTACFFRWTGAVRATVLVVCPDQSPVHIEARGHGDGKVGAEEYVKVLLEVTRVLGPDAKKWGPTARH